MEEFEAFFNLDSSSSSDPDYGNFFHEYDVADNSSTSPPDDLMDIDKDTTPSSTTTLDEEKISSDQTREEIQDRHKFKFRSYDLRPTSARDGKSVWFTWLDSDNSGTYDPKRPGDEERMGRPRRRSSENQQRDSSSVQHSKEYTSEHETEDEAEPTAARLSRLAARQKGVSLTVTFDLTTTALQNLAKRIPDTWPGENHNILSDEHYRFLADQLNSRADGWKPYNLRRRNSAPSDCADTDFEENLVLPEGQIPDPLRNDADHKQVDLRNHPAARGCAFCREWGIECSLLQNEFSWPCDACAAENTGCSLLTAPEKRKSCEHCRWKRLPCSYASLASDPSMPCNECASQGYACVAGPHQKAIRERIRYDKDYSKPPEPVQENRKFVTCTECRREKKSCSLKSKFDNPPCKSCREAEVPCTFEALPRKRSTSKMRKATAESKVPVHKGAHLITTALNHPVHFLHAEDDDCTWCTRNIGICGRGMRDVLVNPSADGLSFTEIEGGENVSGQYDDHMCIRCTMERCRIVGCVEHELRPIEGIDLNNIDISDMLERLIEGGRPLAMDRWCAVCPGPAVYYCCTPQECDMWGHELDPRSAEAEGCGLILCEDCAVLFGEFEDLEQVIDAAAAAPDIWVMGVRADADFLKKDGLLVKNVMGPTVSTAEVVDVDE